MSYLAIVPALHIEDVWMHALPHLLNGKEHWEKFFTVSQIKKGLILGNQQLWVMIAENVVLGIVLTQIDEYPNVKSLRILFLGGKGFKRKMMTEIVKIEKWAKGRGATIVDFVGREEWEPLIEKFGYKSPGKVYRKDL